MSNPAPPRDETPQADPPRAETPQADPPRAETPQADPPRAETPRDDTPRAETPRDNTLRDEILRRARLAGPLKSICPSEVARGLSETWRPLMTPVRTAAIALVREGKLHILRHGKPVADLDTLRGVIRLRIVHDT
jgi:hypothetical protein